MKITLSRYQPIRPNGDRCDRCTGIYGISNVSVRTDVIDIAIPFVGTFTLCPTCVTYYRNA